MKTLWLLVKNSFWSLIIRFAPRFADVFLFILIGRLEGPYKAGIFSLAVAYVSIAVSAMRGPDDFVTRQVLRTPEGASTYFSSFLMLCLGISIATCVLLAWIVWGLLDYTPSTVVVILILILGLIPENLIGVAQATLLGQECFDVPALTVLAVSLAKLSGGAAVLLTGGSLTQVALLWVLSSMIGMMVLVIYVVKSYGWQPPDWQLILIQGRTVLAFFIITALLALEGQADTIVLSALRGESQVGWYRAATTITFSLAMPAQAYQFAVYPLMTRYATESPRKLAMLYAVSMRLLALSVLPMVIFVWGLAPHLITFIFSPEFKPTVRVLRILIFALLFVFLNAPHSRVMLVYNQQGKIVFFVAVSVLINVLFNFILVPKWGAVGTAAARLFSSALFFVISYIFVHRHLIPSSTGGFLLREEVRSFINSLIVANFSQ
jgi:O-antigen/teichoic acid export membrane protein